MRCYVDYEYFPGGIVILTGCCYYKTRPEHVVEVNWSLNDENLIVPDVIVRNSSSFWELQIDSLPVEYSTSIIQCTVSIANRSICETQWHMLAKGIILLYLHIYIIVVTLDKAVIMSSGMLIQWNLYVVVTTTRWQSEICISSPVADLKMGDLIFWCENTLNLWLPCPLWPNICAWLPC